MLATLVLPLLSGFVLAQSTDNSFLGDSIVRENQVQNVLEHEPAKGAECQHVVRLILQPSLSVQY